MADIIILLKENSQHELLMEELVMWASAHIPHAFYQVLFSEKDKVMIKSEEGSILAVDKKERTVKYTTRNSHIGMCNDSTVFQSSLPLFVQYSAVEYLMSKIKPLWIEHITVHSTDSPDVVKQVLYFALNHDRLKKDGISWKRLDDIITVNTLDDNDEMDNSHPIGWRKHPLIRAIANRYLIDEDVLQGGYEELDEFLRDISCGSLIEDDFVESMWSSLQKML